MCGCTESSQNRRWNGVTLDSQDANPHNFLELFNCRLLGLHGFGALQPLRGGEPRGTLEGRVEGEARVEAALLGDSVERIAPLLLREQQCLGLLYTEAVDEVEEALLKNGIDGPRQVLRRQPRGLRHILEREVGVGICLGRFEILSHLTGIQRELPHVDLAVAGLGLRWCVHLRSDELLLRLGHLLGRRQRMVADGEGGVQLGIEQVAHDDDGEQL